MGFDKTSSYLPIEKLKIELAHFARQFATALKSQSLLNLN